MYIGWNLGRRLYLRGLRLTTPPSPFPNHHKRDSIDQFPNLNLNNGRSSASMLTLSAPISPPSMLPLPSTSALDPKGRTFETVHEGEETSNEIELTVDPRLGRTDRSKSGPDEPSDQRTRLSNLDVDQSERTSQILKLPPSPVRVI